MLAQTTAHHVLCRKLNKLLTHAYAKNCTEVYNRVSTQNSIFAMHNTQYAKD